MTRARWRRLLVAALAVPLTLAGCTGVPDSSAPQTVEPVNADPNGSPTTAEPLKGAGPPRIVRDFLDANATVDQSDPTKHTAARAYLTAAARNQWSDQRVTIIKDRQIKTYDPHTGRLLVYGRVIGTINASGIYQPAQQGSGDGGPATQFPFTLKRVDGQYRIDELHGGLLLTDDQFRESYQQHVIYYYDQSDRYLVPDVRWSAIRATGSDLPQLVSWLVDQLVSAPRPELQDVVSTDTFPAQVTPDRVTVRGSADALQIEIPGSSQLDASVRNKLALQLSRTLDEVVSGTITITDGGTPVTIPEVGSTVFSPGALADTPSDDDPTGNVYYLYNGRVDDEVGRYISGPLGTGVYNLTSVAVMRRGSSFPLQFAATSGSGSDMRLLVGTQAGLQQTSVHGQLSRPTWAPGGINEVWIGVGSQLHRLTVKGTTAKDSIVQLSGTTVGGRIRAVRVSPDGSQVALVVSGAGTTAQLFVGAIVRDSSGVRVVGLASISPPGVIVTDADWTTPLRLVLIGGTKPTNGNIYEVGVDGSFWVAKGTVGLPDPPVSITASAVGTWVEAGAQVWSQSGATWQSPSPTSGQVYGRAPVYQS